MYGLVNQAVQDLVVEAYGVDVWNNIKTEAGVDEEKFVSNQAYDDKVTYDLVGAASKILNAPAEDILKLFGEHWVLKTATQGYGDLMDAAGDSLGEFLAYLPNFHTRVRLIFPDLHPPSFKVSDVEEDRLILHYYSERDGLQPFVVGLIEGLGKRFETPATATYIKGRAEGEDHDEFLVTWSGSPE